MQELEERGFQTILEEKKEKLRENGSKERGRKTKQQVLKRLKPAYLQQLNIPRKFKNKGFKNFDETKFDNGTEVVRALKEYAGNWEYHRENGTWVVLNGPYGIGKTHLAAATLRACCLYEAGKDAKKEANTGIPPKRGAEKAQLFSMIGSNQLVQEIKKGYDDGHSAGSTIFEYQNARLLAIDDLGTEKTTEHTQEQLHNLLNYRYEMEAPTIITTNYSMDQLEAHITERVMERVIEQAGGYEYIFFMQGDSYRRSG